jgi:hypothetical protein
VFTRLKQAGKHGMECFMKNTIKIFGIAVLVAVIGFSMAACSNSSGGGGSRNDATYLKVVNNHANTIIKVESLGISWSRDGLNITTGNQQTFTLEITEGNFDMKVYFSGDSAENHIKTIYGETTTITLRPDGKLESDKKGGWYVEP